MPDVGTSAGITLPNGAPDHHGHKCGTIMKQNVGACDQGWYGGRGGELGEITLRKGGPSLIEGPSPTMIEVSVGGGRVTMFCIFV